MKSLWGTASLSVASLSERWPLPWGKLYDQGKRSQAAVAPISTLVFHSQPGEAARCSMMVVAGVEFHDRFFLYTFSIILINAVPQYVKTIKKNCWTMSPAVPCHGQYVFHN